MYSGYVTINWIAEKEKIDVIEGYAVSLSDRSLLDIADAGSMLEYLIENSSNEIIKERVQLYSIDAGIVKCSSYMMYKLTGDKKYRIFGTAMANLENFFISVSNSSDPKTVLKDNLNIIKEIGQELKKIRMADLTKEKAERIFKLSTKLG